MLIHYTDLIAILEASGADNQDTAPHEALAICFSSAQSHRTEVLERSDGGDVVVDYDQDGGVLSIEL